MAKHQSAPERMQWCGEIPPQSSESCDQDFVYTSWLGHAVPPIHRWLFEGGSDGDPSTWQQKLWVALGAAVAVAVAVDADAAIVERSVCAGGHCAMPKAPHIVEIYFQSEQAMHQSDPERTRQCGWIPLYMTGYHQEYIYMRHAALSFHRWLLNGGRVRDLAARQQAFWVQPGDAAEARASTALIVERRVCGGGEQHSPMAADAELVESRVCAEGERHRLVAMHQSAPERTRQCGWMPLYMTESCDQDFIYMCHAALSIHRWLLDGGRERDLAARQQAFWVQPGHAAAARASTALIARASTVLAVTLRDV